MIFSHNDFKLTHSLDWEIEDDEYTHKTRDDVHIQACSYGSYFIPCVWIDEETMKHGATCKNLKQAIEALNGMVSA